MPGRRAQALADAASFLNCGGLRPRAILISGPTGIGKSRFLDELQVEVLAAGRADVIVIDDADLIDDERMAVVRDRLCGDVRTRIAVAAVGIPAELARMIDSFCDRRMIEVPALDAEESRELLAATGLEPWTIVAAQLLESCQGNPR